MPRRTKRIREKRFTEVIRVRIEKEFYKELKKLAEANNWSLSKVIRFFLAISYSLLHPQVKIPVKDVLKYLSQHADENGYISIYCLTAMLSSEGVKQIELLEKTFKKKGSLTTSYQ